jgi:pimeloyl-ACP methyl ester carboxylesterase
MAMALRAYERRFQVNGLELAADEWVPADARGTVFLLHGGGQTRYSWQGTARTLAQAGWTAVSLDARGHGESGWAAGGDYSTDSLVADLVAVVAEYDGRGGVVLVGASMGGLTSLVAVGEGRVQARGLVLVDVAPRIEPGGADRIGAFMTARPEGYESLDEVAAAVAAYNPHRVRPPRLEGLRKNVRLREDGRWHWHWDPAFTAPTEDAASRVPDPARLREAAAALRIPTMLVRGVQSDILSEQGVREFMDLVPDAKYVDVRGAGHMVAGDDNDVFTREVIVFMDNLPDTASGTAGSAAQ